MTKEQRLLDIYTAAAFAILFLVSTANGAWVAFLALALLAVGLVVFPTQRARVVAVAAVGATVGLVVAVLTRLFS